MSGEVLQIGEAKVFVAAAEGGAALNERFASDLMSDAWSLARWIDVIAVPASRLGPDFFRLETRIAGEVTQKFVNYGVRFAVIGDIAPELERSKALRDYVYEANRGRHVWFVDTVDALKAKLAER